MFNGLSLDQAPPISVVMRFFLSVPVFGVLLTLVLILFPDSVLIPLHPVSLGAVHLMFLGVITMSMIGALFQMQSVLGGRPIPAPLGNAFLIHALLLGGILSLVGGFIASLPVLFVIASVLLGSAILYSVFLVLPLLFGGITHDTLRGMRLSLLSLAATALLGTMMAVAYANASFSASHEAIRTIHYSFGLIGWVAVLIIAVAFQVVEMFYVTTAYSPWCKRNVFRLLFLSLALKSIFILSDLPLAWMFDVVIAALLAGFVATTLRRLHERKRRVSDVSIWFWNAGMTLLTVSFLSYLWALHSGSGTFDAAALIAFALFAFAVILGMMGKIVPFLVWFHLNAAGYMETPIMSNVIPAARNKIVFGLFLASSLLALASVTEPMLIRASGIGFLALFLLMGYNLANAAALYRDVRKNGTRFEFSFPDSPAA